MTLTADDIFVSSVFKSDNSMLTFKVMPTKEAEALKKQILDNQRIVQKIRELNDKEVGECDCEYGGCRHSYAEELKKFVGDKK